jgi:hypothetical protein
MITTTQQAKAYCDLEPIIHDVAAMARIAADLVTEACCSGNKDECRDLAYFASL